MIDWNGCQMDIFVNFFVYHTMTNWQMLKAYNMEGNRRSGFFLFLDVGQNRPKVQQGHCKRAPKNKKK